MSGQVSLVGYAEFHTAGIEQCVKSTVDDSLRTDIHPAAGSHLSVVCHTHLHGFVPVMYIVKHTNHHGICDNHARCVGARGEEAEGMTAFHYQCLVFSKFFQIHFDELVLHPVLAYLAGFSVSYEFIWIQGYVKTEIVVYHHLESFSFKTFTLVFVYRFGLEVALGTEAVAVYSAARAQFFKKFRCEFFMERGVYIA